MTAVTLTRTDHARRMARFYVLDVQPDLFGAWCFIREWGRIGRPGQLRHVPYPTEDEAKERLRASDAPRIPQRVTPYRRRYGVAISSSSVRRASDGGASNAFLFLACIGDSRLSASQSRTQSR